MATSVLSFDQTDSWNFTAGASLSASGIKHPSMQVIGTLSGTSSADGSFSDTAGFGQIDYDSSGYMYVSDYLNNRIQRFIYSSNTWSFDSKFTGISTVFGSGTQPVMVAIDRSRNQIHIALSDRNVSSEFVWVWSLANFPNLTSGNVIRKYGANSASNTAGHVRSAIGLTVDDTYAMLVSGSGSGRNLIWNHLTAALVADVSVAPTYSQPCTDLSGNWWWCGDSNIGVQKVNPATLGTTANLTLGTANAWRPNRAFSANGGPIAYYGGRVYYRDHYGRIIGYDSATGNYLDTFVQPGSFEGSTNVGASGSNQTSAQAYRNKINVVVGPDGTVWLAKWDNNSNNATSNCFITMQPVSTATATVTYTVIDDTATLKRLFLSGTNLASDKCRISYKKNAGSFHPLTLEEASDSANIVVDNEFVQDDTITFKVEMSTWDRLDGHATLTATRDKLTPTDTRLYVELETSGDLIVNVPIPSFIAKMSPQPTFRAYIDGAF